MQSINAAFIILLIVFEGGLGAEPGSKAVSVFGNYSHPVLGLGEWFKPALNAGASFGQQNDRDWFIEGIVEYTRFDQENLSGYPKGKVDLILEHSGLIINGKYQLAEFYRITAYLNLGAGLYYWKGIRGEIQPDITVEPAVPYIEERKLEEWNWGFRTGFGLEVPLPYNFAVDVCGYYRFIVGDLWPTLQPHIELESVSGFQTLNLSASLRYYLP